MVEAHTYVNGSTLGQSTFVAFHLPLILPPFQCLSMLPQINTKISQYIIFKRKCQILVKYCLNQM